MRTLLHSHDLYGFVTDGYLEPDDQEAKMALKNVKQTLLRENIKKDNKDLGLVKQGLDDVIFSKVSSVESSK